MASGTFKFVKINTLRKKISSISEVKHRTSSNGLHIGYEYNDHTDDDINTTSILKYGTLASQYMSFCDKNLVYLLSAKKCEIPKSMSADKNGTYYYEIPTKDNYEHIEDSLGSTYKEIPSSSKPKSGSNTKSFDELFNNLLIQDNKYTSNYLSCTYGTAATVKNSYIFKNVSSFKTENLSQQKTSDGTITGTCRLDQVKMNEGDEADNYYIQPAYTNYLYEYLSICAALCKTTISDFLKKIKPLYKNTKINLYYDPAQIDNPNKIKDAPRSSFFSSRLNYDGFIENYLDCTLPQHSYFFMFDGDFSSFNDSIDVYFYNSENSDDYLNAKTVLTPKTGEIKKCIENYDGITNERNKKFNRHELLYVIRKIISDFDENTRLFYTFNDIINEFQNRLNGGLYDENGKVMGQFMYQITVPDSHVLIPDVCKEFKSTPSKDAICDTGLYFNCVNDGNKTYIGKRYQFQFGIYNVINKVKDLNDTDKYYTDTFYNLLYTWATLGTDDAKKNIGGLSNNDVAKIDKVISDRVKDAVDDIYSKDVIDDISQDRLSSNVNSGYTTYSSNSSGSISSSNSSGMSVGEIRDIISQSSIELSGYSTYDLEDTSKISTLKSMKNVIGLPLQFMSHVDSRILSLDETENSFITDVTSGFGKNFTEKILFDMPIAILKPGGAVASFEDDVPADGIGEALVDNVSDIVASINDVLSNGLIDVLKSDFYDSMIHGWRRLYHWASDINSYMQYVDTLCHIFIAFLGIGDMTYVTSSGRRIKYKNYSDFDELLDSAVTIDRTTAYEYSERLYSSNSQELNTLANMFGRDPAVYVYYSPTQRNDSFSNNTEDSILSQFANNDTIKQFNYVAGAAVGNFAETLKETLSDAINGVTGAIGDVLGSNSMLGSLFSNVGEGVTCFLGGHNFDVPKMWASSSSDAQSETLEIKLVSPYGDPESIFLYILRPLARLVAMSLPRQFMYNSYTSPFVIQAFSKGQFNIQLGIVKSLSIKRGGDSGSSLSINNIPTQLDVSMEIEDLYNVMSISNEYTDNHSIISAVTNMFKSSKLLFNNIGLIDFAASYCGYNLNEDANATKDTLFVNMIMNRLKDNIEFDFYNKSLLGLPTIRFPKWSRMHYDSIADRKTKKKFH